MYLYSKNFQDGLAALCQASYSARQAMHLPEHCECHPQRFEAAIKTATEISITQTLAANVISDRPTANGECWNKCAIEISAYGVDYMTRTGLNFGWRCFPDSYGDWDYKFYLNNLKERIPGRKSTL